MEVIYKSENGRTEVRFQCEGQKQLVERLSMLADVIEGEPCGCCGSDRVRAEHRHVQTYDYYCIRCVACGAVVFRPVQRRQDAFHQASRCRRKPRGQEWMVSLRRTAWRQADGANNWPARRRGGVRGRARGRLRI